MPKQRSLFFDEIAGDTRSDPRMPKQRSLFFDDAAGDPRSDPADVAAFTIDYAQWHAQLIGAPLRVCDLLADGYRPSDVADLVSLSRGRVSQLRGELALSWDDFQGGDV